MRNEVIPHEKKQVFSISLRPSVHALIKAHAAASETSLSNLIESVMVPELLEREEIRERMEKYAQSKIQDFKKLHSATHVNLGHDLVKKLNKMPNVNSAEHAAAVVIAQGMKALESMSRKDFEFSISDSYNKLPDDVYMTEEVPKMTPKQQKKQSREYIFS